MRTGFIVVSPARLSTKTVEGVSYEQIRARLDYLYEHEGWTQIRLPIPAHGVPVSDAGFRLLTPEDRERAARELVARCRDMIA